MNSDRLRFEEFIKYKDEIIKDKEKYRPILLELLEQNKINHYIKEIIELWVKEWKEEPNIEIDKLKFYYDYNENIFKEYKDEIIKNKDRYKPILLKLLEENKIDYNIKKEIIEIWEKKWKEEPNGYIDKIKFENWIFKEYKEEIINDKKRYKPILLELLEQDKIDSSIYKKIINIWEKEWKEAPNIYIDRYKWKIFYFYKEEIKENKERYKPILLKEDRINSSRYKDIIDIWEKEWKEEPVIKLQKETINLDKLKFYYDYNENIFKEYKNEIIKNKERYKPALLELLKKNKINSDIYEEIIDIWDNEWREFPNIYIDKFKFKEDDLFKEYKEEIKKDKERYKPIVLELKNKNNLYYWVAGEIRAIWEKDWREEGEIKGNSELIDIDNVEYFIENRDEIINNREKYEVTVRRCFSSATYREIKPILNSWGESDIELLTNLILKSTYKIYNILYSGLKDELLESKDSIIENISKNYKAELKDKVVKLFILSTVETIDELEKKLKLLKIKDIDKLLNYIIKLYIDKVTTGEVFEKVESIKKEITKNLSPVKYIKLVIEIKKSKDNLPTDCIAILKNIFENIESKDNFDSLVKEFGFNNPIEFLKYLKDNTISAEATIGYCKLLKEYYPIEMEKIALEIGESLLEKFDGVGYKKCIEYSKNRDILNYFLNYEDLMKFKVVIGVNKYFNKDKISSIDIEYSDKERIKIGYWGKYKNVKRVYNLEEYIDDILPKDKKYINYEIDSLGFNDKKERYFRYNNDNIVVQLKGRKLEILDGSGTEIKRLSSTTKDFYTVRAIENIKELKEMVKNVYIDGDKGIKKEYCNDIIRDYDLWREIYIDNVMLQDYVTKLIWEEVDSDDNTVGRFRYENGEFCDSNDDEYTINKENRIRLLSLDKVSNDEIKRWREQLDDYDIIQPIPQLELYNIDPKNIEISNKEIELEKLEKNLTLRFKKEKMYFEIENILKIDLEDEINWVEYKKLNKDTKLRISKVKLLTNSDYSLRMVKVVKDKLGI